MPSFPGYLVPAHLVLGAFAPAALVPLRYAGEMHAARPELLLDASGDMIAELTTAGRTYNARSVAEGLSFIVEAFAVGTGGYDPRNPTQERPIEPGRDALEAEILRKGFSLIEHPTATSTSFYCRLERLEAPYGLGELGLFGRILDSPLVPAEVGTVFLYAVVHFPISCKTTKTVCAWRAAITW
jgi:hypothetical protein